MPVGLPEKGPRYSTASGVQQTTKANTSTPLSCTGMATQSEVIYRFLSYQKPLSYIFKRCGISDSRILVCNMKWAFLAAHSNLMHMYSTSQWPDAAHCWVLESNVTAEAGHQR